MPWAGESRELTGTGTRNMFYIDYVYDYTGV